MMKFNETPEQEAYLNKLIESGYAWNMPIQVLVNGHGTGVSREQFEARDGWIVWRGDMSVSEGEVIDVILKNGVKLMGDIVNYTRRLGDGVFAYRLHKPEKEKPASRVFFEAAQEWDELLNGKLAPYKQKQPKGHPHAELMAQYAEDAKATDKPWELWEWSLKRRPDEWSAMRQEMGFDVRHNYRRKPRNININGFDAPEPMREAPEFGCAYWVVAFGDESGAYKLTWRGDEVDKAYLLNGSAHKTKEAAELHAKALLSFTKQ